MNERSVSRVLKAVAFVKITARPRHHARNDGVLADFKNIFPVEVAAVRQALLPNTPIKIWFQDEARVGQKTNITRRWARRGTPPRAAKDQRTKSAYILGAICPARGVGAALVLPRCNTQAKQWHLEEISPQVSLGAHAVLIVDQAGWHRDRQVQYPAQHHTSTLVAKVART